ncbi:hypothetical protein [Isoptericola variabilis]|uniref:hypothetical protein n=1 Tax=Isoptericola variabilis TaxID=139208 RepID=UPI0002E08517|nr:hypothetical protein [Isoptericola variabilis]TWH35044.1 hypothetical protein L600_000100000480 [Isoptericola variabilis J7]
MSHDDAAASGPSVADALGEHLGVDPRGLPVVTEQVSPLRAVDADVALEAVVERHGGGRLVGVGGGEQRMHTSFSEIVEQSGRWRHFPLGAVDYTRAATGPDTERRVVSYGLHLFRFSGAPVAVLQRASSPRFGMEAALEVMSPDEDVTLAFLAELREAMVARSVLRGQVVSGRDVGDADLRTAVAEMTADGERITRSLLGAGLEPDGAGLSGPAPGISPDAWG